jgi:putative flippase GtrA
MNASVVRPIRFGLVGLFNTAFGLSVIFMGKALLGLTDLPANLLGYGLGLLASFVLNRRWTFGDSGKVLPSTWRFGVAFGVAYALNLATVFGLRNLAHLNAYAAQTIGVIPYSVFFYLASAYFVFPEKHS